MKKRGAETSILKVRCFSALSNSTENGQQVLKHLLAIFLFLNGTQEVELWQRQLQSETRKVASERAR